MVYHVFIGIGSNLGRKQGHILRTLNTLSRTPGIHLRAISNWYHNPPLGLKHQGHYINGVIEIITPYPPLQLLSLLKSIEHDIGRTQKRKRWGPRVIDLDILLYDELTYHTHTLQLPHAHVWQRVFTVVPLLDLSHRLPNTFQGPLKTAATHFKNHGLHGISFPDPRRRTWLRHKS